ncbi:MAG: DUF4902 domain-containing protein [Nitrosomonadales bacterium]|nr:DUF4902 domain-containing protein [Nitrosomonadales bacterium]
MSLTPHPECQARPGSGAATSLSGDGYIRLTFESFCSIGMQHLFSGVDVSRPVHRGVGASSQPIIGYTEWASKGMPVISVGWDWELVGLQGRAQLVQTGTPGSNLMFVDSCGQDIGQEQTVRQLMDWLNVFDWQTETLKAVTTV